MSTTFYVWYPNILQGGSNVGHASVKVGKVYMSWWPYAGSKMEFLKGVFASGSSFRTPTYVDDQASEGHDPDYVGDHFGWDDGKAIAYWNSLQPTYVAAAGEIVRAGSAARYQFFASNCATVVIDIIRAAGALDGQFVLNTWLSVKNTFALSPPDVMRVSQYFAGHPEALIS